MKHLSTVSILTFTRKWVMFFVLKLYTPIVPIKGVLPMATKKGIITLTIVISRLSIKPTVRRGLYVMIFNFLKVKTKLEIQIEEYLTWKSKFSIYTAATHKDVLEDFRNSYNYKSLAEIMLSDIEDFHQKKRETTTVYSSIRAMEALRGFMGYYYRQKQHSINPKLLTNQGVARLQEVEESDTIITMKREKRGRPLNVELIKQVKRLRDNEGLEFRQIGRALGKDVSQVYVWYKKQLPKEMLTK